MVSSSRLRGSGGIHIGFQVGQRGRSKEPRHRRGTPGARRGKSVRAKAAIPNRAGAATLLVKLPAGPFAMRVEPSCHMLAVGIAMNGNRTGRR